MELSSELGEDNWGAPSQPLVYKCYESEPYGSEHYYNGASVADVRITGVAVYPMSG